MLDLMSMTVRRKLQLSESWRWASAEHVEGGVILEVSEYWVGPRGGKHWKRPFTKAFITQEEMEQTKVIYEQETGKCYDCEGSGQEFYGWNRGTGNKYRPCRTCGATGMATRVAKREGGAK